MDHSIRGYLSRRTKEELEQIIAIYECLRDNEYYEEVLRMAEYFLQIRCNERSG